MKTQEVTINGAKYTICDNGEVYGKNSIIKQRPNSDGYSTFTAGRKGNRTRVRTYRIVAELFVPNPYGYPEVDHLDANRENPAASNLEWVTKKENIRRANAKRHYKGRINGTNNPKAKLNEEIVRNLRVLYGAGHSIRELH